MPADEQFKDWFKQRRKALDFTQEELARQVGCSVATVRGLEQGALRPSRQLAELVAAALEIPAAERPAFIQLARGTLARQEAPTLGGPVATYPANDGGASPAVVPQAANGATDLADAAPSNPYKGLRAFQEADAADFFGREALIERLRERLGEDSELARFLAVVGPSGAGKSSLVRAGLIPTLRRAALPGGASPLVVNVIPGAYPLEELEAGLLRVAVNPPGSLMEQLRSDERGLARAVKRVLPEDNGSELLLVIDQFEELFTLVQDEQVRADFIDSLFAAVSDPRGRLRVVVTLRADFYDRPLLYLPSTELLNRRSELIGPLSADEMYLAITGPAHRAGLGLEGGLAATIIQDVAEQPGSLPLLQYALTELYERRAGRMLTLAAYRASGGVFGALAGRAESLYARLTEAEQAEARQLFLRLVTPGEGQDDTRRRVLRSESASAARDEDALQRVLELFGRYRMLTFDRDPLSGAATVEVAHEALVHSWARLREWLADSRERLQVQRRLMLSAAEWQLAQQDGSFLASGTRLAQFARLAEEADRPEALVLTEEERTYLAASLEQQQRGEQAEQQRRNRELALQRQAANRLRYLAVGLALFLLLAAGLAAWALNRSTVAQANEQSARDNLARSDALRLASDAYSLLLAHGDTNLIALLSIHSLNSMYSPQGDAALSGVAVLGYPPRQFRGHSDYVASLVFSADGKFLATASDDKTARLWDVASGEQIRVFSGHTGAVQDVKLSLDGKYLFTTSLDHTARQWDVATGQQIRSFIGHTDEVYTLALTPDGKYMITASADGTARLWDIATGQTVRTFADKDGFIGIVAISPDGKYVVTDRADKTIQLWDLANGEHLRTFVGHTGFINTLVFSPDGKQIASGSADHSVRIWDVATGSQLRLFAGHKDVVRGVAYSPDGKYVLSSGEDKMAQLWDATTLQTLHFFGDNSTWVVSVAFSADGKFVAISRDYFATLWRVQSAPGEIKLAGHSGDVMHASFSPDGRQVVTASNDGTARIWDAASGQETLRFSGPSDGVVSSIFSVDGKTVLTTARDGTARLWDAATGHELRRLEGHSGWVRRAAFSPDGLYLVTTSDDGTARTWDVQTGQNIVTYSNQGPGHVNRVAFAPDGKTVVTSGDDGTARIWEPLTGKEIMVFKGHSDIVAGVAFSPDGKNIVTSSFDGSVRLWDVASGAEVRRFAGHPGGAYGAAFSPDGKYIATSGADNTARLWDIASGAEVRRFTGHTAAVRNVVFSPDGKYILTASDDSTARLWHTDYHDTISYVCGLLTRDFTADERAEYGITDQQPTCPQQ